jgi:NAD dependent epimerase/dehydratase family enzyme
MKVLVTGSSGLIGRGVVRALVSEGHEITKLKTGAAVGPAEVHWSPLEKLDPAKVSGFDAVIHLAGENVFGRWTEAKKKAIYESRVRGTRNLAEALASTPSRPKAGRTGDPGRATAEKPRVLVTASAIGYYGARHGDGWLDEDSSAGEDFLARVCRDWEQATGAAVQAGIRVVNVRFGLVLSGEGGLLARMLPIFKLGLGGPVGDGRGWMSWIAIHDAVAAILFCVSNDSLRGAVNVVAPHPVTSTEFAETLGKALRRPVFLRVPELALKILLGREMAENTALASQRVKPVKLARSGFLFRCELLEAAVREAVSGFSRP